MVQFLPCFVSLGDFVDKRAYKHSYIKRWDLSEEFLLLPSSRLINIIYSAFSYVILPFQHLIVTTDKKFIFSIVAVPPMCLKTT